MYNKINSILFAIIYKNSQIIFRNGSGYFLNNSSESLPIDQETVQELLDKGFVTKNVYDGLVLTDAARTFSETIVTTKRKAVENHPGKFLDYHEFPENYKG